MTDTADPGPVPPEPPGQLHRPDDLILSIAAQLVGALRSLEEAQRAEVVAAYCAGEAILALQPEGLRIISPGVLPSPDAMPGYL